MKTRLFLIFTMVLLVDAGLFTGWEIWKGEHRSSGRWRTEAPALTAAPRPITHAAMPAAPQIPGTQPANAPGGMNDPYAGAPVISRANSVNPQGEPVQVRVVKADFKYPMLRVENVMARDPKTGAEIIKSQTVMVADHVTIKANPGVPPADFEAMLGRVGVAVLRRIPNSDLYLIKFPASLTDTVPDALEVLAREGRIVKYAEPDYIVHTLAVPDDSYFSELWGMHNTGQTGGLADADIDAPEAWEVTRGSRDVVVGVIDSGIAWNHPDIEPAIWRNPGEIAANGIDDDHNGYVDDYWGWDFINADNQPYDDYFHGTHVAGTIGATGNNGQGVIGVCWNVSLMALKSFSDLGIGAVSDSTEAVLYATRMGVKLTNNSWGGGGYSQALKDAIDAADAAGILFVAAAGNSASDNDSYPSYPSGYSSPNIISVAASDASDTLAFFSNYGAHSVDLSAPGVAILSTMPGGGYASLSGTSMATPHVAGACALIWSTRPDLDHHGVKTLLLDSVDRIPALAGRTLVEGRLNVNNAVSPLLALTVSPSVATEAVGLLGGPFSPASQTFTLRNEGDSSLSWTADVSQPWMSLTAPAESSLAPDHTATVVATVNPSAAGFAAGTYEAKIHFSVGNSRRVTTRDFRLTVHGPFEISPASGFAAVGEIGGPFAPSSGDFLLANPTAAPVAWRASLVHDEPWTPWADLDTTDGTLAPGQQSHLVVRLNDFAKQLPAGVHRANLVIAIGADGDTQMLPLTLTTGPDHFTEIVDNAANDRSYQEFTFTPAADGQSYTVTRAGAIPIVNSFPAPLLLPDNGSVEVPLTGGKTVALYGTRYSSFFIGSNGYVTFGAGDSDATGTLAAHFRLPRISGFFRDLNPAAGGSVACLQLSDRAVVRLSSVPEPIVGGGTSFYIEMFTDGRIRLTLLASTANQGLIGLSQGTGIPEGFYESDFSAYPETPPAFDGPIQPASISARLGGSVFFQSYRSTFPGQPATTGWRHNGVPLEDSADIHGAHAFFLSLLNLKSQDAGIYDVVLTSYPGQTAISDPAVLTVSPEMIANGSFEQDLAGWTSMGNLSIESTAPYTTTDGSKIVAFNSGNRPSNGAIYQTFACAPFSPYLLEFDVGVLAYNTSEQRLRVTAGGHFSPLADTISLFGTGGGQVNWLSKSYMLNGDENPQLSVSFQDVSTTTGSVDLLLDHVRITPLHNLSVEVTPWDSAPVIAISPTDQDSQSGGVASFHRLYREGTVVHLTAAAQAAGQPFLKWRNNGSTSRDINITILHNTSVEAIYGPLDPPLIDSATTATATQGFHFSYNISAFSRPESYSAAPLPDGLSLSGEFISGVPSTPGTYSITLGATNAAGTAPAELTLTVLPTPTDFLAEIFDAAGNDTAWQTFTLTPVASPNGYTASRRKASAFPTEPSGGASLSGSPSERIYLTGGAQIPFFGESYDSVVVYQDGAVGLGNAGFVNDFSLAEFMEVPRISALFRDLIATHNSISWKQLSDRLTITFQSLQENRGFYEPPTGSNNFQIELFFDGRIRVTLLGITAKDGIIGLSRGEGFPVGFHESDFSNYPLENGLALTPVAGFQGTGPVAGPFLPASKSYVLSNAGPTPLPWTAACGAGWFAASPAGGTLASGATVSVDVTIQPAAAARPAGDYHSELVLSTTEGDIVRDVDLTVTPIPPVITSAPTATGRQGFPFIYQITASNGVTSYAGMSLPAGLQVDSTSGLISGTPAGYGQFNATISATNSAGTGQAALQITINPLPPSVVSISLANDPGWQRQGEWAFGTPAGGGGNLHGNPDPATGSGGAKVFGVNLNGDYSLTPGGSFYLTAGPFDLSACGGTVVQFKRWLNADFQPWLEATLEVSNNGQTWTPVWSNGASPITDTAWQQVRYDISQAADHQSNVFFRWGYQVHGSALPYSGWNIGDFQILADAPLIVTTLLDQNDGSLGAGGGDSLREVVAAAATLSGPREIHFAAALNGGTIALELGQISLGGQLAIDASNLPRGIALDGISASRIFEVQAGAIIRLSSLTLTRGQSAGAGSAVSNHGDLTLENCTVSNSHTLSNGGGIWNDGHLIAVNSTLANNSAVLGGGIATTGTAVLRHATVSGNTATSGGGISNISGDLTLENTIVAGNSAPANPIIAGAINTSSGANLLSGDPQLAPLADFGGPALTMPPLPGSPAIDAAVLLADTPPTDQRGATRPSGGPHPDLGAVEAFPFSTLALVDSDGDQIDDRLETAYHLTIGVNDIGRDSDGDGSSDAEEIANMTDPLNSGSLLKILFFTRAAEGNSYDITFSSFPGLSYAVECDQNLQFSSPSTRAWSSGPATGATTTVEVDMLPFRDFARIRRNP